MSHCKVSSDAAAISKNKKFNIFLSAHQTFNLDENFLCWICERERKIQDKDMEKKMDIKLEQDFSAHNIINAMQRFYFFASIQIFEYLVLKTQT